MADTGATGGSDGLTRRALQLLAAWVAHAERWWYDVPASLAGGEAGLGCYGTGFNWWGVQTNQKYLAAAAVLATHAGADGAGVDRERVLRRAVAALRFSLASHASNAGRVTCTDGKPWGHSWISSLGVERMMHGVAALGPHLAERDRDALKRVLTSEAEWLLSSHRRGSHHGVFGDRWDQSGKNAPESNIWNGAALWRASAMYPDHPHSDAWRERAHEFLVTGVSVPADADDASELAGKPVRERFRGANFFPSFALDHHGYLNVGYMAICVSNAGILHFDLKGAGLPRPETLDRHQDGLWDALRRMVFADGRLARIGGDSRVRYAYCQEYLLPALLYAADRLGDAHAVGLAERQLGLIEAEAAHNGDGSFYGRRLAALEAANPYYYTRLESDRANALGMLLAYLPRVTAAAAGSGAGAGGFEASVAGGWVEPEHGAVLHRGEHRLASFAWRAHGLAQGMCTPPDDGHLAEWEQNLVGGVAFLGRSAEGVVWREPHARALVRHHVEAYDGGFVTCGTLREGVNLWLAEGWTGTDQATHHVLFCALPDGHTSVVLQLIVAAAKRVYTTSVKGLRLNVPNDVFNGFEREVVAASGVLRLGRAERDEVVGLGSRWAHVAGRVGVVGVYGADELSVSRCASPRGGKLGSLRVEEVCWGVATGTRPWEPGATLLDSGAAVLSGVTAEETRAFAERPELRPLRFEGAPLVRGVSLVSPRGVRRAVLGNFGDEEATVRLPSGRTVNLLAGQGTLI